MAERYEFQPGSQEEPEGHAERMQEKFDNQDTPTNKRSEEPKDTPKEEPKDEPEEKSKEEPKEEPEEESKDKESEDKETDEGKQEAPSAEDFQRYSEEFNEKGELSEDTYKELQEKYNLPKEVVDQYIETSKAAAQAVTHAGFAAVGGQEEYVKITEWAKANLSPEEIQEFNSKVSTTDVSAAVEAVTSLKAKYVEAKGEEPNLVEGQGNARGVVGYRSRAEMSRDMRDPRYKTDEAFRQEVQRKIQLSNAI